MTTTSDSWRQSIFCQVALSATFFQATLYRHASSIPQRLKAEALPTRTVMSVQLVEGTVKVVSVWLSQWCQCQCKGSVNVQVITVKAVSVSNLCPCQCDCQNFVSVRVNVRGKTASMWTSVLCLINVSSVSSCPLKSVQSISVNWDQGLKKEAETSIQP